MHRMRPAAIGCVDQVADHARHTVHASNASSRHDKSPAGFRYARGILAGLCELHAARIAMLDVKPGNVLLADDGTPVLTDFGISRELREATRVHTNAILGTPVYMAPEQHDARAAMGRPADLWGWAATVVHMLAGEPPFADEPLHNIGGLVLRERRHPEVPAKALALPGLEQLLLDCFQHEPGARPTAQQALQRLDELMQVGGFSLLGQWVGVDDLPSRTVSGSTVAGLPACCSRAAGCWCHSSLW
jgi:serine/threonine protein kinase